MPRPPGVTWDQRKKCWSTSALGDQKVTKTGRRYRDKTRWDDLNVRDAAHKRKAMVRLEEALQAEASRARPASDPTLDQVCELYLAEAEAQLNTETYQRRVEQLDRALDWPSPDDPNRLGLRVARDLTRGEVRAFLDAVASAGASPAYIRDGLLKSLKKLLNWATEVDPGRFHGLPLDRSPLAKFKGPDVPRRAHREVSPLALSRLVRFAWRQALGLGEDGNLNRRFAMITAILIMASRDTGCRPKELCLAEWSELKELADGWGLITLPPWKSKTGRKTGKARHIPVPPGVMRRVAWIRSLEGRHPEFIFTHRRGRGRGAVGTAEAGEPWVKVDREKKKTGDSKILQQWFGRLVGEARAAGVDLPEGFRLYWHRSAYSTEAQRKGVPRAMLAEAMGTSERMLEVHYFDANESDVMRAARLASGAAAPPPPRDAVGPDRDAPGRG